MPTLPKSYKMFFQNVTLSLLISAILLIHPILQRGGVTVLSTISSLHIFSVPVRSLPVGQWLNHIAFTFALSADSSLVPTATAPKYARGESLPYICCTQRHQPSHHAAFCTDSAVSPLFPARHFSGCVAVCA